MGVVDFGVKTTTGAANYIRRGASELYRRANRPGREFKVTPFTPGSATTAAGLTKLAAAVLAGARSEANAAELLRQRAIAERAANLQVQKLERDVSEPRYSYKTASGEEISGLTPDQRADMEPKSPTPRAPVLLARDLAGYKAGTSVDPAELAAAVSAQNNATTNRRIGNRTAANTARADANSVLRYVDNETNPAGRRAATIDAVAGAWARHYRRQITTGSGKQRTAAAQALGLGPHFKAGTPESDAKLDLAIKGWREAWNERNRVKVFNMLEPKRRAAQSVLDREAFDLGEKTREGEGLSDQDEADLQTLRNL